MNLDEKIANSILIKKSQNKINTILKKYDELSQRIIKNNNLLNNIKNSNISEPEKKDKIKKLEEKIEFISQQKKEELSKFFREKREQSIIKTLIMENLKP